VDNADYTEKNAADRQKMLREGPRQIMEALASLLAETYGGNYKAD